MSNTVRPRHLSTAPGPRRASRRDRPSSRRLLGDARDWLEIARGLRAGAHRKAAIAAACQCMLSAARAALAGEEGAGRDPSDVWDRFGVRWVDGGRFDPALLDLALDAQSLREESGTPGVTPSEADARLCAEGAAEFLAATERLLATAESS